jgi:sigma-B regulation protein RsbU (phosphoserine phosphatase)
VIPVAVIVATAIVFVAVPPLSLPPAPRTSFWAFLATGWKFPTVASMIFGGGYLAYVAKRNRLEDRNRQLQQAIDSEIAERELDAAELQQARDIQRDLLPKEIPQLPEFEITGVWEPAKVVGGDYYDVIQLSKEKLAICIADVVGKGISAALLMANIQAAVRAFASETASPAEVCSRVNSVICTNIASGKFVTMFYGVLDSSTKTLSFTNAGHLRPILISDNGRIHHLENDGALLGVFPHWKYEDSIVELRPGDLLMLFTDGITEAMSQEGTEFGEEGLIAAAIDAPEETLEDLQSQIVGQVKIFCNGRLTDDATLVLVAAPRAGADEKNLALGRSNASEQFIYAGVNS